MNLNTYIAMAVLGAVILGISLVEVRIRKPIQWLGAVLGLALCVPLVAMGLQLLVTPPTNGETTEEKREKPEVVIAATLKERLDEVILADAYPNWSIASELAQCSSDAYLEPVDIKTQLKKRGYQDVEILHSGSVFGYVAVLESSAVVVFRGTVPSNMQNWIVNLDTRAQRTDHGNVHTGFWSAYDSLHEQLTKVLSARGIKRIWITGHSLGGAMAAICSYRLSAIEELEIAGLMTFGQPKVGAKKFCEHMNGILGHKAVYFVNEKDIVPRVPPNFDQFGSLVWYTAGGIRRSKPLFDPKQVRYGQPAGDVEQASDEDYAQIPAMTEKEFEQMQKDMMPQEVGNVPDGELRMQGRLRLIDDHDIEQYIEKLK